MQLDTSKTHLSYHETHRTMRTQTANLGVTKLHRTNICRRPNVLSMNVTWTIGINTTDILFVLGRKRPYNYADPVYGVATICHQVRCLRWGQPSLFHTAMSLLIWYKMFCMRDISYRLIWMKYINMLSVYAQSGTHRPVNWWIIAVLT